MYRLLVTFSFTSITIHFSFFFFNDTPTTEIYTLSLHDALPIFELQAGDASHLAIANIGFGLDGKVVASMEQAHERSEEHTSELQSLRHLVCRLLLEKKKKIKHNTTNTTRTDKNRTKRVQHISMT